MGAFNDAVEASTGENTALVHTDQINVAYSPGLVSPVRTTCVFLGDKKLQRKHLYLNFLACKFLNNEKDSVENISGIISCCVFKCWANCPMIQCLFLLQKGIKLATGESQISLCNLWVTKGEKNIFRVVEYPQHLGYRLTHESGKPKINRLNKPSRTVWQ